MRKRKKKKLNPFRKKKPPRNIFWFPAGDRNSDAFFRRARKFLSAGADSAEIAASPGNPDDGVEVEVEVSSAGHPRPAARTCEQRLNDAVLPRVAARPAVDMVR